MATNLEFEFDLLCKAQCDSFILQDDVHHPVETAEESAVNEAAEKLLSFDLPADPAPVHEDSSTSIR